MTKSKYGRIIAIATTACAILLGIMFIICTAHLFFTGGDNPYSRERVGKYLILLSVPSFITLALAIWGVIYNAMTGENNESGTPRTDSELLESFTKRYDINDFPEDVRDTAIAEKDKRELYTWLAYDFSFLMINVAAVYFDLFCKFTIENLNSDVLSALAGILPLAVLAVAVHIPKAYLIEGSCKRELDLLKASIKENGAPAVRVNEESKTKINSRLIARYVIAGVAVVFVILGIFNGGMADVFAKAVKICTECIGLG